MKINIYILCLPKLMVIVGGVVGGAFFITNFAWSFDRITADLVYLEIIIFNSQW